MKQIRLMLIIEVQRHWYVDHAAFMCDINPLTQLQAKLQDWFSKPLHDRQDYYKVTEPVAVFWEFLAMHTTDS